MTIKRLSDDLERIIVGSDDDDAAPVRNGAAKLAAELSAALASGEASRAGGRPDDPALAASYLAGALSGRERDAYLVMLADSGTARLDLESAASLSVAVEAEVLTVPIGLAARAAELLGRDDSFQYAAVAAAASAPIPIIRPWWRRRLVVACALAGLALLLCAPALVMMREGPTAVPVEDAVPAAPPVAAPMAKRNERFRAGDPEAWLGPRNNLDVSKSMMRQKQRDLAARSGKDCDPNTVWTAGVQDTQSRDMDIEIVPDEKKAEGALKADKCAGNEDQRPTEPTAARAARPTEAPKPAPPLASPPPLQNGVR